MLHIVWVFYYSIICAMVGYGSTCGPPTPPHGSTIIHPPKQEKYEKGSVALFGCKQGYYLVGNPIIKCLGGTWTQKQFRCVGFCPELRRISNGQVVDTSPNIGQAAVEFRCNKNFRLVGVPRLECINGRWNGMLPLCEKLRSCPRLRAPADGILHGTDTTHGAKANFACLTGFDLFGSPTSTCNDGVWSANVPTCKAYCMKVRDPPNGKTFGTRFSHGRVVSFKCKIGFELVGDRALRCIHGRWNSTVPVCKVLFCSKPTVPRNSYIIYPQTNQVNYTHGTHVLLACRDGHFLKGSPIMVCNQTIWLKREFSCIASCPVFGPIKNGIITYVTLREGGEVEIKCRSNYTLVGSPKLSCINGRWNEPVPSCKVMDCGPLDKPDHGDIIEQVALTFGNRIVFECKGKGYEMKGSRVRTCQSDGTWSGSPTTCKIVQCDDPGKPANGAQIVNKGFVYGGSVTFTCNKDYTLRGTSRIYCQENKKWTASVPQCLAPCPDPGLPYQGNRIGDDFRHDKTVTFTCPRDYIVEGVRTITCSDGRWSNRKPSCKAPCAKLAPPAHGTRSGEGFRHGASVMFYCRYGYTRVGASPITCNDGNWNNPAPVCKGICPQPRTPYKGILHGNKNRFIDGDEVTFSCVSNHDLFGKDRLRCVGKNWNYGVPDPECKERCRFSRRPGGGLYVEGRIKKEDMIKHGEKVTYGCLTTYTMVGAKTQECDNGRWINDVPICKASCRSPGGIAHGKKKGTDYRHDKTVWYQCNAEYTLKGNDRLTCNDGKWDFDPPECKAPCSNPGTPVNGSMQGNDFRHNSWVVFACDRNYQLDGNKRMQCNDGSWSGSVPNCFAVCPDPGEPSKGKRLKDNFREGETVTFKCNRNHDLVGNDKIRCDGGVWSGDVPKCKARCAFDGNPENGDTRNGVFRTGELLPHGSKVEYACTVSYTLAGSNVRHCDDGSWNTSLPSCKASCDPLPALLNGKIKSNSLKHGALVSFSCNNGFQLKGSQQIICIDGKWNASSPTCKGTCKDPGVLENGNIIGDDYSYDSSIRFECNIGYGLLGPTSLTCKKGIWNGRIPACKKRCQDPGKPQNGWKLGINHFHGGSVQFTCINGSFDLLGASKITCIEGKWSDRTPSCEARCSDPGMPENGTKDGDDYRSKANVTFRCNPPLELIGSHVIFCQNGKWSDSRPICSNCARPLGLENTNNQAIKIRSPASSIHPAYRPNNARLNGPSSWCPSRTPTYLQIDLGETYKLTAISTQGGPGLNRWVPKYKISFYAGGIIFVAYSEAGSIKYIPGNKDASSLVKYKFKESFITSTVRIHPVTAQGNAPICLRMELYGCDPNPDCILVGSMFWGLWKYNNNAFNYYKAYITKLNTTHVDFVLKIGRKHTRSYRRTKPVLIVDTVPKLKDISVNSSVIARHQKDQPFWYRSGTVVDISGTAFALVKFDDGITLWVTLENLRLVKRPHFCVNGI